MQSPKFSDFSRKRSKQFAEEGQQYNDWNQTKFSSKYKIALLTEKNFESAVQLIRKNF